MKNETENLPEKLQGERRKVAALLAKAELKELASFWSNQSEQPQVDVLRGPETGLVMVRGRIGGGGAPFNLGETTVTRATVRVSSGASSEGLVGHSYALGRDHEKARLAAIADALWQAPQSRGIVERDLLQKIAQRLDARATQRRREAAATKVDFFTMVRGDD
ncbi:phosphonate C-P lyase system protein PhnG [Pseudochrobactrum sp. Wa41.01b-1]|uniref:phosphonate C-P lyase system protein PhnG n=1 Tax=Pseudochrobactrum sp. Wa41.01b-1 TaxID=2864102 RepID=UPI001C68BCCE|nr:phosphonate C-P lyase system protein PhnG [Pseudochrobactrum sp. Wa41.01b-1]QYM72226.1 phosphonate C-P lyase system protein PhnG [Pseudochrobactrum sp. Wa41.01b-1]